MHSKAMVAAMAILISAGAAGAQALKTDDDRALYVLGYSLGKDFQLSKAEIEVLRKGMQEGAAGAKPQADPAVHGPKIQDLARSRASVASVKFKKDGTTFAEKAALEKGAQKTSTGLVFLSQREGKGPPPAPSDIVKVHYRGTLIDGTEFDSSYKRNEPIDFPLNRVIPCWTEGVQKMKVGGKAKLVCPSDIAYGDRGSPPNIPGGSTLVFEVELLEVKKGEQPGHSGHGH